MMYTSSIKNTVKAAVAALFLIISVTACEYETIEIDLPDDNDPVSFSTDIVPIFTNNNNCTACHKTGGTSPDLTPERAFNSIVPSLVNNDDPEASRIYQFPHPSSSSHGFKKYTPTEAAMVLNWIKQGAENN